MDLYRDTIIQLYKNPLNKRIIPHADFSGIGTNPMCGDRLRMYAKSDSHKKILDCSFEGEGCAIFIAAASLLTEEAKGKTLAEIAQWNSLHVFEWLGTELGPSRVKCGVLPLETLQEALKRKSIVMVSLSNHDKLKMYPSTGSG